MTAQATLEAVRKSITVQAPLERAFSVFTEGMASWWPPEHHIIGVPLDRMAVELRPGGRCYDVGVDGSECDWGRVLAYEPPTRFVLAWHLGTDWAFDPDPAHASEVEVLFTADGPNTTRVDLTHRHLERHGPGAEQIRTAVDSPDGWPKGLTRYAQAAATAQ
jgi:uncharacterized protein YndB with AHSA1/START domain